MFTLAGFTITSLLKEGSKAVLYRGIRDKDQTLVIIKGLRPEACNLRNIEQLKHEYVIAQRLNTPAVVKAYSLELHQGIPYLILEDFEGRSLDQLLSNFREPSSFLKIAIQIVEAIAQIHKCNLVHKDIKPQNIIVNLESNQVKVGDFGIASSIPYEPQVANNSHLIVGSLPYMSPEQTGRMNRGIDYRSDLYSLGVTFYEMLTGQLPFQGNDPLEWVHCHIAKFPPPPIEVIPEIPQPLSDIVMKLLAKVAEQRYESALGLRFDLEYCLEKLQSQGKIDFFALGQQDFSERLQIPQKLYGRELKISKLLEAFERVVAQGTPEIMLVSGYSGVGKSSLVNELQKPIVKAKGIFITGKFDQYKRDIPYFTLVQAFQTLVRQILTESEDKLTTWKTRIQAALGNSGKLITDVIPEVELIVGKQPSVAELGPAESQNRFNMVFQSFMSVFAHKQHPLTIFLDDMQWADSGTLNLLQTIITGSSLRFLCLIFAFRDNEVDPAHPFSLMLSKLRQSKAKMTEILLAPLKLADINQLIADTLHCSREQSASLARLVIRKTNGNPFFTNEFIKTLYKENLLKFDRTNRCWHWDQAQIEAQGITDNVVSLMIARMQKLPQPTQHLLRLASCFGNRFDLTTLSVINEKSPNETIADIWEAILEGLIASVDNSDVVKKTYRFQHDRIQQAAYSLIPEAQRKAIHLRIGQMMLQNTQPENLEDSLFDIVNQLNMGIEQITNTDEKAQLVKLNFTAGKKAKAAIAYVPALKYFNFATQLLPDDAWDLQYEQTFSLFQERAECEYLAGNLEQAEELFKILLGKAQSHVEQANIYILQLRLYQIFGRYEEALALGIEALKIFQIILPDPDSDEQVQVATEIEKSQITINLGKRQISDILNAPVLQDPTLKIIISLLTTLGPPCYLGKPSLFPFVVLKAINYSLKLGNTEDSCFAYSMYAMLLVSIYDDIPAGYAFSQMSIQLNQKLNDPKFKGTVLHIHGSHINVWYNHISSNIPFLEQGFIGCVEAGDVTMANYNGFQGSWQLIMLGNPLAETYNSIDKYASFAYQSKHEAVYQTIRLQQQLLMNLRGLTHHPLTLSDDNFDEAIAFNIITEAGFVSGIIFYHIIKLIVLFTYGKEAEALQSALKISTLPVTTLALPIETDYVLYYSLILAALYPKVSSQEQKQFLEKLKNHQSRLQYWAEHCPANFLHKSQLIAAEIARIEGQDLVAMRLYEQAISSAHEHSFVQNEALAYELAAKFYLAREFDKIAKTYFQEAKNAYLRWGAIAKVTQLEEHYPIFLPRQQQADNGTFLSTTEQLDFLSIVKASQTISSEIVFSKLLKTLMHIVIEQAVSEIGYLLLYHQQNLTTALKAKVNKKENILNISQPFSNSELSQLMPQSILNYVQRTQEAVILNNAAEDNLFCEDEYVIQKQPKSVLCLPITRQSQFLGIIYLENNLITGAFTHEKLAVLEILAAQIAISLENARLYQGLKESQERLNLALKSAQIGVWSWDIINDKFYWDEQIYQLFGVTPGTFSGTSAAVLARLHPDDRELLVQSLSRAINEGVEHDMEYRIIWNDGSIRHIASRGRAFFDEEGAATRMSGIVLDITERKQANVQQLQLLREQTARAEAEQANRAKDEFLAVLGHELRTPLNSIIGFSDLLLKGKLKGESATKALQAIARNGKLQAQLIEDLLDVSRIITGKVRLDAHPIPLHCVITAALDTVHSAAQDKGIQLHSVVDTTVSPVFGDPNRLQQVFWNLLSNAIKFTPNGGRIDLRLERIQDKAVITVSDNGQGIEPDFLPYIFDRFRQAESSTTRSHSGLGLGLAIVRYLIELHGGNVTAHSQGKGQGATFTVTLPLLSAPDLTVVKVEHPHTLISEQSAILSGVTVLVVDDEADGRELLQTVLKQCGAEVVTANSVKAALEILNCVQPNIIVSDIAMPEEDGYALIRQIRMMSSEPIGQIPAIALTAYAAEIDKQQALKAGFKMHLSKPVDPEAAIEAIATLVSQDRAGMEIGHGALGNREQ
ncbi:MAG: AAA family ATPase [Mojavia pulchra JT2-VF2]|jgi:PAS domain S-box-containing protein|uniref:Circadian input-output histidine kinase CikA n=1 Tax=Mojavia pulchra JT2-VF2 TaxID=287848 RepID=A0A951Q073_9NOST|nr:AAA family ATPase [Mojavia pulchra JT2-VF2]